MRLFFCCIIVNSVDRTVKMQNSGFEDKNNAAECKYKELDRHLKEQFINGLNDDGMDMEIISEHTSVVDTMSVTSEQVLA